MDALNSASFDPAFSISGKAYLCKHTVLRRQIDCYADAEEERVMSNVYTSDDMTSTVCRNHCEDKGALYYATQVRISGRPMYILLKYISLLSLA